MDRGAWQATVHKVTESDTTEATWRAHMHRAASYMEVWCVICLGVSRLFPTPWTVVCQATLTMEFSRQEYWSGLPFPFLGDLPNPGIKPGSPALQADSLPSEPPGMPLYCLSHSFYMENGCKWLRAMKQLMHRILAERVGILRVNSRKLCSEFCRGLGEMANALWRNLTPVKHCVTCLQQATPAGSPQSLLSGLRVIQLNLPPEQE